MAFPDHVDGVLVEEVAAMAGSRVMVAEDDPGLLEVLKVNLEQAGYDVVAARDGVDAYLSLEVARPDAVVLDLSLPRMSGFRLVKLLRRDARWKPVPVIVVTGFAFEEVEEIADEGIQGFLRKPFEPSDLVDTLELLLARGGVALVS